VHTRRVGWKIPRGRVSLLAGLLVLLGSTRLHSQSAASQAASYELNDVHFHLTNYIQQGTDIHDFLKLTGNKVGRVALFGIPLQQDWSYQNSGDFAPTYYLQTDAALLLLLHRCVYCHGLPLAFKGATEPVRPDDYGIQSVRYVRCQSYSSSPSDVSECFFRHR
jgi:hypothetical protein